MALSPTPTPIPIPSDNPFIEVISDVYDFYVEPFFQFLQAVLVECIPFYFWLPFFMLFIGSITVLIIKHIGKGD